jgi:hypothetical protein
MPSDSHLALAADEIFNESIEGMTEADYAGHPTAWLRYGFDEGPMFVIEVSRDRTVTLSRYADQDDIDPSVEYQMTNMPQERLATLWNWLARGEMEKIRAEYPDCGW